jgi:GH15 family glucan-1,4-alpha-glucosidase
VDASLIGLWYFCMFAPDDPKIVATMQTVRERLWVKTDVGGVARYENDYYHQVSQDVRNVPGNPWFICTLWLAQWHIATAKTEEDLQPALDILNWAAGHALPSGVMAEQVHPYTNAPLSVSPLTWSHATLVMAVREYVAQKAKTVTSS